MLSRIARLPPAFLLATLTLATMGLFSRAKNAVSSKFSHDDASSGSCPSTAVTLDFSHTHEDIIGLGGSMAYYTNWVKHHPSHDAIYDALFTGLRPSLLRFRNTFAMTPDADPLTDELKIDGELFYHAEQKLGYKPQTLLTSWSPPVEFKDSGETIGGTINHHGDDGFDYTALADWWVKSVRAYRGVGIDCTYVSPQNEPDYEGKHDCCLFEEEEKDKKPGYTEFVVATHNAFAEHLDVQPKLVGPEHTKIDGYLPSGELLDKLGAVGNHMYGSGSFEEPEGLLQSMKGAGKWARKNEKMLFMTEYGKLKDTEEDDCIKLGEIICNTFVHGGVSAYWHWDLFWGAGTGEGSLVLVENPWTPNDWKTEEGFWLTPSYWWFRHFCRFIRPGMTRVHSETGSDDILAVGFKGDNDAFTAVIINKATSPAELSLSGVPSSERSATVFQTGLKGETEEVGTFDGSLSLPPRSITTVTTEI